MGERLPDDFLDWPAEERAAFLAERRQRGEAESKPNRNGNGSSHANGEKFIRAEPPPAPVTEIILRRASEIKPEPISWLWKFWLARGKLHIIAGAPEAGKTTIALSYAAIVSTEERWPDGTRAPGGNVLIWTSEDGVADTLIPRLTRMGADLDKIHIIEQTKPKGAKSRPFNPATDVNLLVEKAKSIGDVVMLILYHFHIRMTCGCRGMR